MQPHAKKKVEIEFINRQIFDIVQLIQRNISPEERNQALGKLELIGASLLLHFQEIMKIKDREVKKALHGDLLECRNRANFVLFELRQLKNLSFIPNDLIAKLNDMAYKAIKTGSLNKLLDKRAIANEDLYQKLEKETFDIVSKLNFEKLEQENNEIVNQIGDCLYSVQNTIEALKDGDCMCIGLEITRPEAAIADASRLVINGIYPTYMTAESFLNSAKFNLESDSNAHGGFGKQNKGKLATG